MRFLRSLGAILVLLFALALESAAVPAPVNRCTATAEVVSVERHEFPSVSIKLFIKNIGPVEGYPVPGLEPGEVITVIPILHNDAKGKTDFTSEQNQQNIGAWYFLQHDIVTAQVEMRGDERSSVWIVRWIQRIAKEDR